MLWGRSSMRLSASSRIPSSPCDFNKLDLLIRVLFFQSHRAADDLCDSIPFVGSLGFFISVFLHADAWSCHAISSQQQQLMRFCSMMLLTIMGSVIIPRVLAARD